MTTHTREALVKAYGTLLRAGWDTLWDDEQKAHIRSRLAHALATGTPVTCPVDGADLNIAPAHGLDGHRECWVTCPECRRECHFDSI